MTQNFISTGKLKYVAGDFPLPNHQHAFKAAVAAHCGGEQGKYWEMAETIFENFRQLQPDKLPGYAEAVGLDVGSFEECLASGRHEDEVKQRKADGQKAGISATPMFLVGYTQPGSTKFKATEILRGAQPYAKFQQTIERLIKEQSAGTK